MTVGELFVNIGIKGAAKVGDALSSIGKGMVDVTAQGLAAKAAVGGLIFGLEQFMSGSAAMGMSLKQFANLTGFSAEELQKWQFAARQSGVEAEEVSSSIKGIQSAMAKMQLGQGPPGGFGIIGQYTGGFDFTKVNDTFYMLEKLKKFAQNKAVPIPFANEFLKQSGLTDNMIQFLRTTQVELGKVKPSEIFKDSETSQLAKISVAWANLRREMTMMGGHFTAKYGMEIVSDLGNAAKAVMALTDNIIRLTKAFPELKAVALTVGAAIAIAFAPITTILSGVIYLLSEFEKHREGKKSVLDKPIKAGESLANSLMFGGGEDIMKSFKEMFSGIMPNFGEKSVPTTPKTEQKNNNDNVTINQNITHYGDAKDTKGVKDLHRSGVDAAYRNNPAQNRAT